MSFTACKTFANVASKLLRSNTLVHNGAVRSNIPVFGARGLQTQRTFTRSMWFLSRQNDGRPLTARLPTKSKMCGCCGLHTKGDEDLVQFLSEEISHEKKLEKTGSLPQMKGFSIHTDGTLVTLSKEADGEKITIEMNINHSVEDASPVDYDQPQDDQGAAEMVARPPFIVKLNKGGSTTLGLQCEFTNPEEAQPAAEEEEFVDVIEISEAAVLEGSEWDDKIYAVSGSVMDGNLYDMLMNMLEERGIDGTFMDEMVSLATAYDHKQYIGFLENLKSFAGK